MPLAKTKEECEKKFSNDAVKLKKCLELVQQYKKVLAKLQEPKIKQAVENVDKRKAAAIAIQKIARGRFVRNKDKNRIKQVVKKVEKGNVADAQTFITQIIIKNQKKTKKKCAGTKKTYCGRTKASKNCRWKKGRGCVAKSVKKSRKQSRKSSVKKSRKQSGRRAHCSGKRKKSCQKTDSCRWSRKKSRCRRRTSFNNQCPE